MYLVKYGSAPASIITSYQVFNRRANRQESYGGIKSGVVVMREGQIVKKRGSAVYKQVGEQLLGGWAEVQFKDGKEPAYVELALTDYSTGKSNWAKMPGVMIEKCAKAGAWRLAYPDEFGGMYTGEEMDQKVERDMGAGARAVEAESVEPVADLQPVRDLFKPFMAATALDSAGAMAAICAAVGCSSGNMHDMTLMQARRAASWMEEEIAARKAQPEPAAPEPEPAPVYESAPAEYATDDDLLGGF